MSVLYLVLKRRILVRGVVDGVHEEDGGHVVLSEEQPQHGPGLHAATLRLHPHESCVPLKEVAERSQGHRDWGGGGGENEGERS